MHAMDRQSMIDAILGGGGRDHQFPDLGSGLDGCSRGLNPYEYSVDKAKQLLSEAGWDPDQKVVALVVNLDQVPIPPIVQNQFKEAGIDLELLEVEITELIRRISSDQVEFEIFFNGGDTYRADPNISLALLLNRQSCARRHQLLPLLQSNPRRTLRTGPGNDRS